MTNTVAHYTEEEMGKFALISRRFIIGMHWLDLGKSTALNITYSLEESKGKVELINQPDASFFRKLPLLKPHNYYGL